MSVMIVNIRMGLQVNSNHKAVAGAVYVLIFMVDPERLYDIGKSMLSRYLSLPFKSMK